MSHPFPDGTGYMDFAWPGLSQPQRWALDRAAQWEDGKASGGKPTRQVLRRYGLIDEDDIITDRGRDLMAWARQSGWTP